MQESRKRIPEQGEDVVIYLGQTAVHARCVRRGKWNRRIHFSGLGGEISRVAIQGDVNAPRAVFAPGALVRRTIRAPRRDQNLRRARPSRPPVVIRRQVENTSGQTS